MIAAGPTAETSLGDAVLADARFAELLKDVTFAQELYGALTNTVWHYESLRCDGSLTFREAAGFVADLRGRGEHYLDFYGSSSEGVLSERVAVELKRLGWTGTVMT